jgi:hypothetical protein
MTNRHVEVLAGIASELDADDVLHNATTRSLTTTDRVVLTVRLPDWLAADLKHYATRAGLSTNELITWSLWTLLHGDSTPHPR